MAFSEYLNFTIKLVKIKYYLTEKLELSSDGMVGFAKLFDLAASLKSAEPKIKKIWDAGTLDTPNDTHRGQNTQWVGHFFWTEYAEKYFGGQVGFTQATDDLDIWPAEKVVKR